MDFDDAKIDDAVLALLWLNSNVEHGAHRAWKSHSWDAMARLHERGMISAPQGKAKSVFLTDAGVQHARELAKKLFGS